MEPIDTQALNKKLAGWARPQHKLQSTGDSWGNQRCIYCGGLDAIAYPIKEQCIPNFTNSLDACFKWFGTKFKSMACGSLNEEKWKGAWAKVIERKGRSAWAREENIEPALALCLAIERLIDEKDSTSS